MHTGRRFTDLDRLYDIRVLDTLSISRLAHEPSDGSLVLAKLLAQDLDCNDAMGRVLGAEDSGCAAFSHFAAQRISREGPTYKVLFGHVANLTSLRTP
jgi:hypothetical protein